jgi:nucleoside-diphosphate-sugar epimerase
MRLDGPPLAEVLLTGATGFLGKLVLLDLLTRREALGIERIHLLIRPGRSSADERFRGEIAPSPVFADLPEDWIRHVRVVPGDLVAPGGLVAATDELSSRLTHVIHCAASVDFDLPVAAAVASNTTSALRVLELAKRCPRIVSMTSVSTAYVTPHGGDRVPIEERLAPLPREAKEIYDEILAGDCDEDALLRETGHPNTYTLTKCIAEHLLVQRRGHVPLSLVRPSIISASWRRPFEGWIDSPAAFALFIVSIATGRMRAVVARARARLDVVPVDEVSERVVDAAFVRSAPTRPAIVHAVAGYARSLPLSACREAVHEWFQRHPVTSARQGPALVHYMGAPGPLYRFHHWRHHLRRRDARLVAPRIEQTNRRFAYFTRNTFRFASSVPFTRAGYDAAAYVRTVCRGVAVHLLDADLGRVSFAGRRHPRVGRARKSALSRLDREAEVATFDLTSFESALRALPENARVTIAPAEDSDIAVEVLQAFVAARTDLWRRTPEISDSAPARLFDAPAEPGSVLLPVRIDHSPSGASAPPVGPRELGRLHLACEAPLDLSRPAPRRREAWTGEAPLLVTGASGFLGRHVLRTLDARDIPAVALVRDPSAWDALEWTSALGGVAVAEGTITRPHTFAGALPALGGIIHMAAVVRHSRRDADEVFDTNVDGTLAMVRLAAQHRCRLVLVSTSGTVGCFREPGARADENSSWCEEAVADWPYYRSKLEAERSARALAEALGVELVVIRPPVLLGPGDHRFRSTSHVVRALRRRLPFVVRGGMHFSDVRDAAYAIVRATQRDDVRPVYHLDGRVCSVADFFEMIEQLSGVPGPRVALPYRPAWLVASAFDRVGLHVLPDPVVVEMAAHHWGTRSLHAPRDLGYKSRDARETLRDTIDWIRAHHPAFGK